MDEENTTIERVRVLHGHRDPDSAYEKDGYPYGSLRTVIRFYVETATTGPKKGMQRFVSQTRNPKKPGAPWNKPRLGHYYAMVIMYLDTRGHVQWLPADPMLWPTRWERLRLMGIPDQLPQRDRRRYDALLALSRRAAAASIWDEFDVKVTLLAEHVATGGGDPQISNGVWTRPAGDRYSLGDPEDVAVYLAAARESLAEGDWV